MSDFELPSNTQDYTGILEAMQARIVQLEQALTDTQAQVMVTPTPQPVAFSKEPKVSHPTAFTGRKDEAAEFILKCDMVFSVQPRTYSTDKAKLAFVTNLLKDQAYQWVMPHLLLAESEQPTWVQQWDNFKVEFKKIFGDSNIIETSRQKLKVLRQIGSATSYATEFQRHAAHLHWGDEAMRHTFFDGLKDDVKDKLLTPNGFDTITNLIDNAIKWDDLLFQRRRGFANPATRSTHARITNINSMPRTNDFTRAPTSSTPSTSTFTPTPMEIDAVRPRFTPLTPQEKEHRFKNNLCLYCGKAGHSVGQCPIRPANRTNSRSSQVNAINARTTFDSTKNSKPQA